MQVIHAILLVKPDQHDKSTTEERRKYVRMQDASYVALF